MYKLGLKNGPDSRRGEFAKFVPDMAELAHTPDELDYVYAYPAVDNQGPFGTCVAFGNKKVFEFFRGKRQGKHDEISGRALFSQIKHQFYPGDIQDDGAQVSDGIRILEENYVLEKDMPYDTSNFARCLDPVPDTIKRTDFIEKSYVAVNIDVQDFEMALFKHGPLVIGMNWQSEWMEPGPDGRLNCNNTTTAGGHCVAIVGYNRNFENLDGSKGAFLVVNNWSAQWAKHGYCYLPYNAISFIWDAYTVAA